MNQEIEHEPSVRRLTRDLKKAAETMTRDEARYLVDAYYISQEDRKRAHNQVRAMTAEPHTVIKWLAEQGETLEGQIKRALDSYTDAQIPGRWMKSVFGVGPVIAAGLLAHIDITRAPTVGHIYSFAGIAGQRRCDACGWMLSRSDKEPIVVDEDEAEDPDRFLEELCPNCSAVLTPGGGQKAWTKGQKRPFNAGLKTLVWKTGQCFMKFSNNEECVYGAIYKERKAYEIARNERGDTASDARQILAAKRFGKDTEAFGHLSAGHLPPAQIDGRARRFAAKIFLSHAHAVMFFVRFGRLPPNPYALDHLGHAHFIKMPNPEIVPGLVEALRERGLI